MSRRNICQGHPGILHTAGNRQTDATGASAKIQDSGGLLQKQRLLDRQSGHSTGIITGDQHILCHMQPHAVEIPFFQDVGQRFSRKKSADSGIYSLADILRNIVFPVRQNRFRRFSSVVA